MKITQGICKFCNRPVYWACHIQGTKSGTKGSSMPVDIDPVDGGNIVLSANGKGEIHYRVLKNGEVLKPGEKRRVSHFKTCPNWVARKEKKP